MSGRGGGLLGLAGILLLALAAVLSVPGAVGAREPGVAVLLVDASASAVRRRPDWSAWARDELAARARLARAADERVAVALFAADVVALHGPSPAGELLARIEGRAGTPLQLAPPGGDGATDLAGALELASAWLEPAGGRVVLLGDGTWTGRAPKALAAPLVLAEPPAPARPDAALEEVVLPARAEPGAPLAALVRGRLAPASDAPPELVVELEVTGAGGGAELARAVTPGPDGAFAARFELGPAAPGTTRVRARARIAGDPVPENDSASAATTAGDALRVALVAPPGADGPAREFFGLPPEPGDAPRAGIVWELVAPARLAGRLGDVQAVVSVGVGPADLAPSALSAFVEGGGGWLHVPGWAAFERGGEPAAGLLPLEPAEPSRDPRDVLVLVDGSGSMAGEPFDAVRRATFDLVRSAPPGDEVALAFFGATLLPSARLRSRGASVDAVGDAASVLLDLHVPRGSTYVLHSLEALVRRRSADGDRALVLLLTDGRETTEVPHAEERAREVVRALGAARTELVVVAVGPDADREYLRLFVGGDGTLHDAAEPERLTEVFQEEVHAERLREGPALEVLRAPGAPLVREVFGPAGEDALPPLRRAVRSRLRPGAARLWVDDRGAPLLAAARAGAGRTAAWASIPTERWAPAWRGRGELLLPLVRWAARRDEGARARRAGGELEVEGWEPGGGPVRLELWPAAPPAAGLGAPRPLEAWTLPPARPAVSAGGVSRPDAARVPLTGPVRAALDAAPGGLAVLSAAGRPTAALALGPGAEFRPARALPGWGEEERRSPAGSAGGGEAPAPHPLALPVLLLGLGATAAAAVAGRRGA